MSHQSRQTQLKQEKPKGFKVWRPGQVNYRDADSFQGEAVADRQSRLFDLLILLEHPPVITFGRSTDKSNLLLPHEDLKKRGIDCCESRRGGDITLHNPGQLVGYPIVDLNHYNRDLHRYLRLLEQVIIATLKDFNLKAETKLGKTGVWVADRKIASIGVAVRHWISYHGFALNIDNDLSTFDAIIPCGLHGVTMTSMGKELNAPVDQTLVEDTLIGHFGKIMQRTLLGSYHDG